MAAADPDLVYGTIKFSRPPEDFTSADFERWVRTLPRNARGDLVDEIPVYLSVQGGVLSANIWSATTIQHGDVMETMVTINDVAVVNAINQARRARLGTSFLPHRNYVLTNALREQSSVVNSKPALLPQGSYTKERVIAYLDREPMLQGDFGAASEAAQRKNRAGLKTFGLVLNRSRNDAVAERGAASSEGPGAVRHHPNIPLYRGAKTEVGRNAIQAFTRLTNSGGSSRRKKGGRTKRRKQRRSRR